MFGLGIFLFALLLSQIHGEGSNGNQDSSLVPALNEIAKRKRDISSKNAKPYSAFNSLSRSHRYRYPLYKKRSYYEDFDYPSFLDQKDHSVLNLETERDAPKVYQEVPLSYSSRKLPVDFIGRKTDRYKYNPNSRNLDQYDILESFSMSRPRYKRSTGKKEPQMAKPKPQTEKKRQVDETDLLAREYFNELARASAKKRMAYGKFVADKKSTGFGAFIENPSMLQMAQQKLKEVEEEVVAEAQKALNKQQNNAEAEIYLEKSVARLNAIEKIKDSLHQLELLQEDDVRTKRLEKSTSKENAVSGTKSVKYDKSSQNESFFNGNRRDECPILERLLLNCAAVSKLVGDAKKLFVEPCLYHEICYMCGSERDVTRHECDAVLSSGLETSCTEVELQYDPLTPSYCYKAASEAFSILTDETRYDEKGTCTHDPCIRQILDSR